MPKELDLNYRVGSARGLGDDVNTLTVSNPIHGIHVAVAFELDFVGAFVVYGHEGDFGLGVGQDEGELGSVGRQAPVQEYLRLVDGHVLGFSHFSGSKERS